MSRDLDGFIEKPSVCAWEAGYHRARLRPSSFEEMEHDKVLSAPWPDGLPRSL